jgi:hypothetical protein
MHRAPWNKQTLAGSLDAPIWITVQSVELSMQGAQLIPKVHLKSIRGWYSSYKKAVKIPKRSQIFSHPKYVMDILLWYGDSFQRPGCIHHRSSGEALKLLPSMHAPEYIFLGGSMRQLCNKSCWSLIELSRQPWRCENIMSFRSAFYPGDANVDLKQGWLKYWLCWESRP